MLTIRRAEERGHSQFGWLNSYHTFSFGHYHDPKFVSFHSLRVLNDDTVSAGAGFGNHSHRDMEIISYVLSGSLQHNDSMGNLSVLETGSVQYISAGSGIEHSEYNASERDPVHFLQIWIIPNRAGLNPRYAEKPMPQNISSRLSLVCSETGRDDSIQIHQSLDFYIGRLNAKSKTVHSLNGRPCWVQIATGEVRVNDQIFKAGDGIAIEYEQNLEFNSDGVSEILLFDFLSD